ncbi:hypothetical protein TNCV_4945581 [Trichonephila clavipes]|nr:hypothetical protein TNCV_4945581 [Trichonephila clavipes]
MMNTAKVNDNHKNLIPSCDEFRKPWSDVTVEQRSSIPYRKVYDALGRRGLDCRKSFLIGVEEGCKGVWLQSETSDVENFSPGVQTRLDCYWSTVVCELALN